MMENRSFDMMLGHLSLDGMADVDGLSGPDVNFNVDPNGNKIPLTEFDADAQKVQRHGEALEKKLDPKLFVRIHRCTIINIECLREFRPLPHGDYMVKLIDGKELIMSRNYRRSFRQALSALSYTQ
jgi:hypothetical protein